MDYPINPDNAKLDELQAEAEANGIPVEADGKLRTKAELADDLNAQAPAIPDAPAASDLSTADGLNAATTGPGLSRAEANEREQPVADGLGHDPLGTEKGYIGGKVDPRDNSDHSLESGLAGVPAGQGQEEGRTAEAE